MASGVRVRGVAQTNANLRQFVRKFGDLSAAGLMAGGLKVQALAQKRVSVEYGFLRASAYTRKGDDGRSVVVGFTAAYAVYVHENLEMKLRGEPRPSGLGVYWGPAGRSKYLESAFNDLREEIVRTVAAYAAVDKKKAGGAVQ